MLSLARMGDPPHFRRCRRQPITLRVQFRRDDPAAALEHAGTLSDVGIGGAFVATDVPPPVPVGARVRLSLSPPTSWDPIEISATVRWISDGRGEPAGFGVRFEALSGKEAAALYELVHASAYAESAESESE